MNISRIEHKTTDHISYQIDADSGLFRVNVYDNRVKAMKLADGKYLHMDTVEGAFIGQFSRAVAPDRPIVVIDGDGIYEHPR